MALIICPECGKEISDKAPACINCGCPVSAMKAQGNPAPAKQVVDTTQMNSMFGEFFGGATKPAKTVTVKPVPEEMPELKFFPGLLNQILEKLAGILGLAGFLCVAALVATILGGELPEMDIVPLGIGALAGCYLLTALMGYMEFCRARKFIRKNGYEDSIRYDSSELTNVYNAFNLCPRMHMVKYISALNPAAGQRLKTLVDEGKVERRKAHLGYVPYLVFLTAAYILIGNFGWMFFEEDTCLIANHLITLVVSAIYAHKKGGTTDFVYFSAVIFAPMIFAYYYEDLWYHIPLCGAAAFLGQIIGSRIGKKKS